jgi:hypothetical protein
MDAAPARGLRETCVAEVVQQRAGLSGDAHGVIEVGARLRVQVESQLVGMVDVIAAHRPGMERDRAHLRRPGDIGHFGRADLVSVPAGRELDARGLHVIRRPARNAFLKEGVAAALLARREDDARMHALGPALERGRAPVERAHDAVTDRQVVLDDIELRDRIGALGLREDHAVGVRHAHVAPTGIDGRGFGGHAEEFDGKERARALGRQPRLAVKRTG